MHMSAYAVEQKISFQGKDLKVLNISLKCRLLIWLEHFHQNPFKHLSTQIFW